MADPQRHQCLVEPSESDLTWDYVFVTWDQVTDSFQRDSRLFRCRIPRGTKPHFQRDYRNARGVLRLGYTNPMPILLLRRTKGRMPQNAIEGEKFVRCDQGNLAFDEALGNIEFDMLRPDEIQRRIAKMENEKQSRLSRLD